MKAEIRETGILEITIETELESYALSMWIKENIHSCTREIKKESIQFYDTVIDSNKNK